MRKNITFQNPGPIAFFGSGETAPSGQKIFDYLFKQFPHSPHVSILETPAGFELNSPQVAENVANFIRTHLQNHKPQIEVIPARKKGTDFSTDDPDIATPILESDLVFMGPGSPTYAVKQLKDSLVWEYVITRHRQGAGLALSSATTIAISSSALPVYEIYKVGEDLHWYPGLDLFAPYGLSLVFIPHWNNKEGGKDLDTSRCFMGESRFEVLHKMLPEDQVVVGIDEHTGLIVNFQDSRCQVIGLGNVSILTKKDEQVYPTGCAIKLSDLGNFALPEPQKGIRSQSWQTSLEIQQKRVMKAKPPQEIITLANRRERARIEKAWQEADELRSQIEEKGWQIHDRPDGYKIEKK